MATRKFILTHAEVEEMHSILNQASGDAVYDRLRAVLAYHAGHEIDTITNRYGCSRATLMNWCKLYRQAGVEALVNRHLGGNNARLSQAQLADLTCRLAETTPRDVFNSHTATPDGRRWTVQDLYRAIRLWYGIAYRSPSSYYTLLARLGPKRARLNSQS